MGSRRSSAATVQGGQIVGTSHHIWQSVLLFFVLATLGLLNNPPWKGFAKERHVEFTAEPMRVAMSLWQEHKFANPFSMRTGYTAHVAPALPILQSLILRFAGAHAGGWLALRSLPALALSLQLSLLPWIAPRLGFSIKTGVLAWLFGLLLKPDLEERWESHIAGLAGLLLTAAACFWMKRDRPLSWAIATGALAGLASYLNPVLGGVYLAWVLYAGRSPGYFKRNVLPLWIVPLLMMTPWTIRNVAVMRGLFPIRDDLGLELYVSYNDCAPYSFRENMRDSCITRFHPNSSPEEAQTLRALGEYRYDQTRFRKALAWIRSHPARAAALTLQRIWFFWFPSENGIEGYREQKFRMLALHTLTVASFLGLYLSLKRRIFSAPFLLLWIALFPLIYYLVQFEYRYRYPLLWTTCLLAAEAIRRLARRPKSADI